MRWMLTFGLRLCLIAPLIALAATPAEAQSGAAPATALSPTAPAPQRDKALTKPDRATSSDREIIDGYLAQCLKDWDAGTHMTKKEWSAACRRLLIERGDYKYRR